MNNQHIARAEIIGGPSKAQLSNALFYGKPVKFIVQSSSVVEVYILSVEAEDGSYHKWNISGHFRTGFSDWKHFKGFYSTPNERGFLDVYKSVMP